MKRLLDTDRGVSLVMVTISLFLLIGVAALAIDLAAMRADRSVDQKVTDTAASAGALAALDAPTSGLSPGQAACETALAYVQVNTPGIGTLDSSQCATVFSATCTPGEFLTLPNVGRFTVTVTYPVADLDPLMTSAQLGAPTQAIVPDEDGAACERVGVEMSAVHQGFFSQVLGFETGTTTVWTVARSFLPPPEGPPINLLILDRFGCGALMASGGGSDDGGIIVDEIVDPVTGEIFPGEGAVDSDASIAGGCPSDEGTIDVNGNNAVMRADGPPNCGPWENPSGSGQGCGFFKTLAPGTPGCNWPACTGSGSGPNVPNPEPIALPARITRAPIDHRYNCRTNGYDASVSDPAWNWAADPLTVANEQDIPACEGPHDPRIHDLIASVRQTGSPAATLGTWTPWSTLHPDCDVNPGEGFSYTGNVWVDCATLNIRATVTINGSLVIGNPSGDLAVTSFGHLILENTGAPGFLFMRGGVFSKDGQASITLNETMVYLSKSSSIFMDGGGGGRLIWIAPDDEDHPFDDLALWSDSTTDTHFWAGQAFLEMEGVFFVPIVTVEYRGKGIQFQVKAQFIADKLHAHGNGVLVVAPVVGRAVDLQAAPRTMIIR